MDWLKSSIDFFLHIDKHLAEVIRDYGAWTYLILTLIVFCETGLVVTPILPGDSLLFAAGTFAALGSLNVHLLFLLLTAAAILGDTVNYAFGKFLGPQALKAPGRFLKKEHLERTQAFYAKHGGKTIILARFVPIVRTFAPFVAGVGVMSYGKFLLYNVVGGTVWVALFVYLGYFFGNVEIVKKNFSLVILAIIGVSVLPIAWEMINAWREKRRAPHEAEKLRV
jgi:membrane-associated protein